MRGITVRSLSTFSLGDHLHPPPLLSRHNWIESDVFVWILCKLPNAFNSSTDKYLFSISYKRILIALRWPFFMSFVVIWCPVFEMYVSLLIAATLSMYLHQLHLCLLRRQLTVGTHSLAIMLCRSFYSNDNVAFCVCTIAGFNCVTGRWPSPVILSCPLIFEWDTSWP